MRHSLCSIFWFYSLYWKCKPDWKLIEYNIKLLSFEARKVRQFKRNKHPQFYKKIPTYSDWWVVSSKSQIFVRVIFLSSFPNTIFVLAISLDTFTGLQQKSFFFFVCRCNTGTKKKRCVSIELFVNSLRICTCTRESKCNMRHFNHMELYICMLTIRWSVWQ